MVDRGNNFSCDMAELGGAGCQSLASLDSTIFFFDFFFRSASYPQATSKIGENPKFQWSFLHHDISAGELELAQPMPHPGHGGGPLTTNLAESWGVKPESDCDIL